VVEFKPLTIWRQSLITETKTLPHGISEQEVIHGAKQGDPDCFEFLYNLHKRHVYALCFRITHNTAEAEDLTQEVFLQLFRKVATFRGDSAFSTWLHRVAVNVALMHLRKKCLPAIAEPLETQTAEGVKKEIGAADESLAVAIDRIVLERSVQRLPPGYKVVFLLHDVEGYEHKEIARMMRCSIGNSKSQLHKARLKLRSHLQMERPQRPATSRHTWQPEELAA
jgi:RNA polymerase sigma-70 factor (ECF subfamily)